MGYPFANIWNPKELELAMVVSYGHSKNPYRFKRLELGKPPSASSD